MPERAEMAATRSQTYRELTLLVLLEALLRAKMADMVVQQFNYPIKAIVNLLRFSIS